MAEAVLVGAGGRQVTVPTGLFIDNSFSPATRGETIDLENPATGKFLAKVAAAQVEDVDRAVSSSADAFKSTWRFVTPDKSRSLLNKLADLLERDAEDLASIEALDAGMLYRGSLTMSIPQAAETCRYYAGWVGKLEGRSMSIAEGMAYTRREPIGVCAAIVPWNAPLMITMWKLAPAIAAGNTVIVKTPEIAPLYAQKLAQLIREAGFPPGVVNIVCGLGQVAGQAQATCCSARTNLKKVTVELGGKGPSIVFADASWENALLHTTMGITVHNGQICAAGSRIYVQDEIYDRYVAEFSARTKDSVAGDPLLDSTTKGPLVSAGQKSRVTGYIQTALQEGNKLLHGADSYSIPSGGHFVSNTAFVDVPPVATIMREEVFGPVASIARFKTEEEVVGLANDTNYGLSAAVFTDDINKAMRVSDAIECGQVTVNMWGTINSNTPFGGFKESGFGRDLGQEALEEWTQVKCVKFSIVHKL
ncbi:aldehyde dehydrogenase family protein [Hirsutella rhossiliensis]|uniref:aldehyde dehydrogenase (NAD(+)) n=1 Tax=Hirsutella rhossiliensis TaxID=111463 RepID=A0A9P8SEA4_9HYPO|nr:aldehyde dehydrogenase family domain-containing protein [Hirsutella rhossiliensis]KAH0958190.1 aldehyde dehydrogenase family domain-containing protein [Hirsutella rhossiliensis]